MSISGPTFDDWNADHRRCRRCVDAGFINVANPVFSSRPGQRILLIGQAPGPVEADVTRPFAGRAGRELMRWLVRAGFADEADVRSRVHMTSMTSCFPGRLPANNGDRRPSAAEVALCRPWLDGDIARLDPRLILTIGTLALSRFLPKRRLDDVVGNAYDDVGTVVHGEPPGERILLPLPHPSGQSRWNNDSARVALREQALARLAELAVWACRVE